MPTENFDIVGSYNNQRNVTIDPERSINWFEYIDPLGKKPKNLIKTSGLINQNYSFGGETHGSRAQFNFNGVMYGVMGASFYRVTSGGVFSILDTIDTVSGYVGIDANTFQIIIVDGTSGYIWDTTASTFEKITDTNFPANPIDVCYLDGFFVVADGDTKNFYLSLFDQGMVWGSASDNVVGVQADGLFHIASTANYATGIPVQFDNPGIITNAFTALAATDIFTVVAVSDAFTASSSTNLFTIASTAAYNTGSPVTFTGTNLPTPIAEGTTYYVIVIDGTTFKIASTNDDAVGGVPIILTNSGSGTVTITNTNFATGIPVKFAGGGLPNPIVAGTTYWVIKITATTFKVATSYANAFVPTSIDLTTDGSGTVTVSQLPTPIDNTATYYVINKSATTFKVATSYANAIADTPVVLTSDGTGIVTSLGQLQQGSITTHPGNIVACRTLHRRLFLFSEFFTEVWENAGVGTNLPFRRNNSLLIEFGTPAIGSIAVSFDRLFFLSQSRDGLGAVMEVIGTSAMPVSTRALDYQLSLYASNPNIGVSDCRGFLIKENGLIFYRMNFTLANHTFVYNETMSNPEEDATKYWHEEEVLNSNRHPAQTHAYFNGKNYVGHYSLPIVYVIDPFTYTNDGETIRRVRISKQIVSPDYKRRRVDRLQLDLLQGQIPERIDDEQLYIFLSVSKDGGQTYTLYPPAPMGKIGQRTYRTLWRKLGVAPRGQSFVFKIEFFGQVDIVVLGASWSYEILPQ